MNRLRIGLVYDALWPVVRGGAERRYHEVARRLAQRHDVTLITWRWWDGPQRIVRDDGVHLHGLGPAPALYGADGKRRVAEVAAFALRLVPTLLARRFDVVEVPSTLIAPLWATAATAAVRRTPLVAMWHEIWAEHWTEYLPDRPLVAALARRAEAASLRLGTVMVTGSAFTAGLLGAPAGSDRLRIIPNGTPLEEIAAARPAADRVQVTYVGRLIDEKRIDLLIAALARLSPDVRAVIVGEGPERLRLETQALELGIAERVNFAGRLPPAELYGRLRSSDLFVLPSVREGYGLVVREAQASGAVPVVVRAPFSAAASLLIDGVDGLVSDPTVEGLSAAIAGLLADPARRAAMALSGKAAAERESWAATADATEALYLELAERGR